MNQAPAQPTVQRMIETALATFFGFVLALMWYDFIKGALLLAGVSTSAPRDWPGLLVYLVLLAIVTVLSLFLLVWIARVIGEWETGLWKD